MFVGLNKGIKPKSNNANEHGSVWNVSFHIQISTYAGRFQNTVAALAMALGWYRRRVNVIFSFSAPAARAIAASFRNWRAESNHRAITLPGFVVFGDLISSGSASALWSKVLPAL
jgi:hypothetical protein